MKPQTDKNSELAPESRPSGPGGFLGRGGLWVVCQGILFLAVLIAGVAWPRQWNSRASTVMGILFLVLAALCGIAGAVALGRNLTPFPRPDSKTRLVQHGIYALMRHPLYTAVTCASIAWGLLWASWPALVAALALIPFFDAKARREERWLREQFPEYAAYERRAKRFIPWVY